MKPTSHNQVNLDMFSKSRSFRCFESMGGSVDTHLKYLNFIGDIWILSDYLNETTPSRIIIDAKQNKKESWYKKTIFYTFVHILHSCNFILSSLNKFVYFSIPIATWNYECCWPHDVLKCCQNEFVCNGEEVGSNHSPSSVGLKFSPLLARTFGQSFEEVKLPMNLEVQIDNVRQ